MPISNRLAELRDPIRFIEQVLINAEDNRPFRLYAEQKAFLRHAFEFDAEGRMKHTELCFSSGKKGGKTGLAGMICIFTAVVLAGQGGEIYCLANDFEQSSSRVFKAVVQILQDRHCYATAWISPRTRSRSARPAPRSSQSRTILASAARIRC